MSMTYVDLDLLEQIRDRMALALSRLEECAGTLRQMYSQMQAEDMSLSLYPQWDKAVYSCGAAMQKVERLAETANRLLLVVESAPDEYRQIESQHSQAIERLSVRMSTLGSGIAGVMDPSYPVGLQEGENGSSAMDLERQTMMAVTSLELANLMAVTQVLQEEYAYDQVLPVRDDRQEEEEKKKKSSKKTSGSNGSDDKSKEKEDEQAT